MNKNTAYIAMVLIAVVFAAGGFFGGMQYQKGQTPIGGGGLYSGTLGANRRSGTTNSQGRLGGNGAPVVGQVLSEDTNSITVKLQDGSSKIVITPGSATISKTDTGSRSDITVGSMVAVFGTTNSDGSVTAQNVQLNPQFRMRASASASPAAR